MERQSSSTATLSRRRRLYEPSYAPPESIPNEWVATPIDANWYFVWEDWN